MTRLLIPIGLAALLSIAAGCGDDDQPGAVGVDVAYLEGYMGANLMPVVPPDPIGCQVTLELRNPSASKTFLGLDIPSAEVYRREDGVLLGEIRFNSLWDGRLSPGDVDTVLAVKVTELEEVFPPQCGKAVYLRMLIEGDDLAPFRFETPNLDFGCAF